MRINLVTPFAEKDAVKALGARWDATKKCWYIVDVADLTPFLRWMPDTQTPTESAEALAKQQAKATSASSQKFKVSIASRAVNEVPHCGCQALPWEDCAHTAKP